MESIMHVTGGSIEYDLIKSFYKQESFPAAYYAYIGPGNVIKLTSEEYELERRKFESWKNHKKQLESELIKEKRNHEQMISENERKTAMWKATNNTLIAIIVGVISGLILLGVDKYFFRN